MHGMIKCYWYSSLWLYATDPGQSWVNSDSYDSYIHRHAERTLSQVRLWWIRSSGPFACHLHASCPQTGTGHPEAKTQHYNIYIYSYMMMILSFHKWIPYIWTHRFYFHSYSQTSRPVVYRQMCQHNAKPLYPDCHRSAKACYLKEQLIPAIHSQSFMLW
jgi:hypothetical protein